jgi:predicted  nucleic acid-binding Zn-ribbon protein
MKIIGYLNLLGVVLLAGLCATQWNANRLLNLANIDLNKTDQEQARSIAAQQATIKGLQDDLNDFRSRLMLSEEAVKKDESRIAELTRDRDRTREQLGRMTAERDEMRESLTKWEAAVKERDEALKKAVDEIQTLAKDRNDNVVKYNELAVKYNAVVKDLNESRAKQAAGH